MQKVQACTRYGLKTFLVSGRQKMEKNMEALEASTASCTCHLKSFYMILTEKLMNLSSIRVLKITCDVLSDAFATRHCFEQSQLHDLIKT